MIGRALKGGMVDGSDELSRSPRVCWVPLPLPCTLSHYLSLTVLGEKIREKKCDLSDAGQQLREQPAGRSYQEAVWAQRLSTLFKTQSHMQIASVCGYVAGEARQLAQSLGQTFLHQIRLIWMGGKNWLPLGLFLPLGD